MSKVSMISRCGLTAITQNLRFWKRNRYIVAYSTTEIPGAQPGHRSVEEIVRSVNLGGSVTLINNKDRRKIIVKLSDCEESGFEGLPYSYVYVTMATSKERFPAKVSSAGNRPR